MSKRYFVNMNMFKNNHKLRIFSFGIYQLEHKIYEKKISLKEILFSPDILKPLMKPNVILLLYIYIYLGNIVFAF